jgi:L-cystine uptake protein TcyP (sodium:dicarboxylate symporter family)
MNTFVEQRRGSIRENRNFWLAALAVVMIGISAIVIAWFAGGVTIAASIMLFQLGAALAAGFR